MKPGLDRIKRLLDGLGNPQKNLKVILVGGTNGKGSVCAYLSSILTQAGYKTGLYTSPHLVDYNERIKLNNRDISPRDFARLFARVQNVIRVAAVPDPPTVFEILTAMAILYFAEKKVDLAVCEVGLGGTFDATNILDPLFSVITNVDLEHTEVLGKTLNKIAKDKAGIVRPGAWLVTGDDKAVVIKTFRKICEQKQAHLVIASRLRVSATGQQPAVFGLRSNYQSQNLAVVGACIKLLKKFDYRVSNQAVSSGVKHTFWPARFQILSRKPMVILDGAHNPAGVRHLIRALQQSGYSRPAALVFGAIKNKDTRQMLKVLLPHFDGVMITAFKYPTALPPRKILRRVMAMPNVPAQIKLFSSPLSALQFARQNQYATILVCGSLYLAGDLLEHLDGTAPNIVR